MVLSGNLVGAFWIMFERVRWSGKLNLLRDGGMDLWKSRHKLPDAAGQPSLW